MQHVDGHATTTIAGTRRLLRMMLFGLGMVLTVSAAAALPVLLG